MAGFDLDGALAAGHSAREIADFLAQRTGMDVEAARAAGHSDDEIARFLAPRVAGERRAAAAAAPAEAPEAPSGRTMLGRVGAAAHDVISAPRRLAARAVGLPEGSTTEDWERAGASTRALGVGARGAMHMVGALPGALYDVASLPVRGVAALTGLPQPRSSAEVIDDVGDALGLPQPQGATERMINRVGTEVGAMGVGMGAGQVLQRAARALPSTSRFGRNARVVGDALASSPGAQTAGAVGAGLAGGAVSETTDSALADMGASIGGGLAGAAMVPIVQGTARGLSSVARMFTERGAEEAAASALLRASDDPMTLPDRLRRAYRGLPESAPTAGEAAGDSGLLQLERALRNQPEAGPQFNLRDSTRDAARTRAIEGLAPGLPGEGAGAEEVARGVSAAGERVRQNVAAAGRSTARRVDRAVRDMPAGRVAEDVGPIIREDADAAYDRAWGATRRAEAAVDPEGRSRLPLQPVLARVEQLMADRWPRPGSPPPRELDAVVDRLRQWMSDHPDGTIPFRNLQAIRHDLVELQNLFGSKQRSPRALAVVSEIKATLDDLTQRAAQPYELPTAPRTQADISAEEALEAAAQHPDVVRALQDIAGDPRAWSAGPQPDGPNLLVYLRQAGGIRNTGGEMRHMMSTGRAFPGLWNNRGLSIHNAMERAIEGGYFPGHDIGSLTETEFLDALREGLRGRHRFPGGTGGGGVATATATRGAFTDDLAREIEARGGRFVPGDPDETLASLRQASDDPSTAAFQPGDPPPGQPGFVVDPVAEGWAFTPEQAAQYRQFIEARTEQGRLFERGAMGRVTGRGDYGSRQPDAVVAQQFFHGGNQGAADVRQFVEALGERGRAARALEAYAAQSLRDYAFGPDGRPVAARVRSWLQRHAPALRQMPEVAAKFENVGAAARTAEAAVERGTQAVRDFEAGAARYWLKGTEPEVAIERALSASNAEQNVRQLRVMMRGDAPALRGLRRAYGEVWLSRIRNTNAQHADESRRLRADASRRWVEDTERAARALFSGDELERIQQIARDFSSGAMITSVGRAVGSNTAQNLASMRSLSTAHVLGRMTQGLIRGDAGGLPMTLSRPLQFLMRMPEQQVLAAMADLMLDPSKAAALTERVSRQNLEMVRRYAERSARTRLGEAAAATGIRTAARAAGSSQAGEAQRDARREEAIGRASGGVVDDQPRVSVRREMAGLSGRGPHDDGKTAIGRFMAPVDDDPEAVERIPRARFQVPYTAEEREAVRDNVSIAPARVSGRRPILAGGERMPVSAEGPAIVGRGVEGALDLASEFLVPGPMDAALAIAAPQLLGGRVAARVVGGLGRLGLAGWRARAGLAGAVGAQDPIWGGMERGAGELGYADGGRVGLLTRGIRAFHGSPHAFDRFSLDRIGSGEGAQSYGRGLYFAENEDVARHYRDMLSGRVSYDGAPVAGSGYGDPYLTGLAGVAGRLRGTRPDGSAIDPADAIREEAASWRAFADEYGRAVLDPDPAVRRAAEREAADYRRIADMIEGLRPDAFVRDPGHMYEVRLHADPGALLDHDLPLGAQPAVADRLRAIIPQIRPDDYEVMPMNMGPGGPSRWGVIRRGAEPWHGLIDGPHLSEANARAALDALGPGDRDMYLRDLDDSRRGSVAWSVVESALGGPRAAAEAARAAGLPGIRYLDSGSRGDARGTSNFVMFDDGPIEIIRRYRRGGLAGV